jgi:hypothetical protein
LPCGLPFGLFLIVRIFKPMGPRCVGFPNAAEGDGFKALRVCAYANRRAPYGLHAFGAHVAHTAEARRPCFAILLWPILGAIGALPH